MNEYATREAAPGREGGGVSSLRDVLTIVFKRRRLILASFLTTVLVATLATLLWPPTYECTAAILVKKSSAQVPLVPKESSQLIISEVTEADLNSEIAILKSRQAIEEMLHGIGLDESWREDGLLTRARRTVSGVLGGPQLAYFDEMVLELEQEIAVSPVRKSNVLQVAYRHTNPKWATRVVNGLTERYITRRTQVYQSAQAVPFFEEEMRAADRSLKQAEDALETYSRTAGVSVLGLAGDSQSLAAQKEATLRRLTDLEGQLGEAGAQVRQQTERVAALKAQLEQEPNRLPSALRLNQDPTTEELERALVALELKRDALAQDFTPENRQVRDVDDQIRAIQARLKEAEGRVASINRTEVNTVYQDLRSRLLTASADLNAASARYESLQKQVASYRQEMDGLTKKGLTADGLRREVRAAEDAYMLYRKKHEEARISAAMDKQRIVNVSIAQPAEQPLRPVAPRKALNLALGVVLGIVGGFTLAFVATYFDHSFTTGREIEAVLGIPLLGTIPEQKSF